jgi:outer membrane protein assembly factor BamB
LITNHRGVEFISLTGGGHSQQDWLRGACMYGVMPCNGLLYVPPHQCFCYPGVMLTGFNALGTAELAELNALESDEGGRFEKGPAFELPPAADARDAKHAEEWPTYRHDPRRSGATESEVPARAVRRWRVDLKADLTPPVMACGKVFVAGKDRNTLYALEARSGRNAWTFTANGPLDSPPTCHGGSVFCGCADGWVYCLRASDGALAWRFRAAPRVRLIVDEGRVASAWRVHGSVLAHDGLIYCTAGRSSMLDGGLWLYALDPRTGDVKHEARLHTLTARRDDAAGKAFVPAFHIEGARSDILVAERGFVYLGQNKLDGALQVQQVPYVTDPPGPVPKNVAPEGFTGPGNKRKIKRVKGQMGTRRVGSHLFTTHGFLDDAYFNRAYWMHAETWPGFYFANASAKAGQLLVVGPRKTYSFHAYPGRKRHSPAHRQTDGYPIVADLNTSEPVICSDDWNRDKPLGFTWSKTPEWVEWIPVRVRAMVLAGARLFVAGPPAKVDSRDPMAAYEGRTGASVLVHRIDDGHKIHEFALEEEPVFDGMIAAAGNLYISTRAGTVLCLGQVDASP